MVYTYDGTSARACTSTARWSARLAPNLPVSGDIGNAVLGCYDPDELTWEMYDGLLDDVRIYDTGADPGRDRLACAQGE